MKRVLVIGGYGNFGQFISKILAQEATIELIIAGRNSQKADALCNRLEAYNQPHAVRMDINHNFVEALRSIAPDIVIHTSGPFQNQSYHVAKACIEQGCHYIDLADGRDYVAGICTLNAAAKSRNVFICSGASSVPGLSSALINHYLPTFNTLKSIDYAISTAHNTSRGLATTKAVLSYAGKPFTVLKNHKSSTAIGWRGTRTVNFWQLGPRKLGNCDIPDLELFPKHYTSLQNIRFQAGLELSFIHRSLAVLAWLVQHKLCPDLHHFANIMMRVSSLFDIFGTEDSGFFMALSGTDQSGNPNQVRFDLVARGGDGLYIPTIPAIILAIKLANDQVPTTGAYPCLGFVSLEEYLEKLKSLNIRWQETFS